MDSMAQLHIIVDLLVASGQTASQFLLALLNNHGFYNHPANDIPGQSEEILNAFLSHPNTSVSTFTWALDISTKKYTQSIRFLAQKSNGWHFNAYRASAKQLEDFRIEGMANNMRELAPELWDLLGLMLGDVNTQTSMETECAGMSKECEETFTGTDTYWLDKDSFATKSRSRPTLEERRASIITIVRAQITFKYTVIQGR
jgi:hypothetical protein